MINPIRTALIRAACLSVALATSPFAFAQTTTPAPPPGEGHPELAKVREACHDDVERLCKGTTPGQGHFRECLRAHKDELSDGCKAALQEARAHHHPKS